MRAFASVLKPGGVLGVEEHRARPGTTLDQIKRSGYVTEDLLIERAAAAGFVLQARSEVNANPLDSKDHPNGVWSLPPTLRGGDVDPGTLCGHRRVRPVHPPLRVARLTGAVGGPVPAGRANRSP